MASIALAALSSAVPGHADNRLRIDVWPNISTAPATIRIRAIVQPNADNRALEIAADSGDFFRSSYVPISGVDAAAVTETTLKDLPGGEYDVSVGLVDAQGRKTIERRSIVVKSGVPGR
jgi:hypothetical protein